MTELATQTLQVAAREIGAALNDARGALEAHVEQPENHALLERCASELHQVQGALRVLEIYGAARLAAYLGEADGPVLATSNTSGVVVLANGGGLRGSRVYPAGPVSRRMLLTIQPFGNVVCKVAVTGQVNAINGRHARSAGVSAAYFCLAVWPRLSSPVVSKSCDTDKQIDVPGTM